MKQSVKNLILELASKRNQIVYGQRSINVQLPQHLKRKTEDYDIFTKNPKGAAQELADRLNKMGNGYTVKKAVYGRTWKVKDKEGNTIADYTIPGRKPKTKNVLGVKYADLEYSKHKAEKILRKPEAKYRWHKDEDVIKRIRRGSVNPW